jgi:DNA-binding XRE family transcriptional regulator
MGRPRIYDLDYHRQRCGYTQVDMAELLDIALSTWQKWLCEASRPRLTHQYRLASLFDMPLSALWKPVVQEEPHGRETV